jgi:hypothetical protein
VSQVRRPILLENGRVNLLPNRLRNKTAAGGHEGGGWAAACMVCHCWRGGFVWRMRQGFGCRTRRSGPVFARPPGSAEPPADAQKTMPRVVETNAGGEESQPAKCGMPLWFRRAVFGVGRTSGSTIRHFRAASWRIPEAGRAEVADGAWRIEHGLRSGGTTRADASYLK